jgi:hypothetical protein
MKLICNFHVNNHVIIRFRYFLTHSPYLVTERVTTADIIFSCSVSWLAFQIISARSSFLLAYKKMRRARESRQQEEACAHAPYLVLASCFLRQKRQRYYTANNNTTAYCLLPTACCSPHASLRTHLCMLLGRASRNSLQ